MDKQNLMGFFEQSCEMYRHFVEVRSWTYGIGSVVVAGLVTLLLSHKGSARVSTMTKASVICVLAAICLFDFGTAGSLWHYHKAMVHYSQQLGDDVFMPQLCTFVTTVIYAGPPTLIVTTCIVAGLGYAFIPVPKNG